MTSRVGFRAGFGLALALLLLLAPSARAADATSGERARVRAFLGQWLAAWRAQDIEAYLALYAADARVDARDRQAHAEQKRRIFARGERPVIEIGDVEIDADESTGVRLLRARFDQAYSSPALTDFGRKELLLRDFGSQIVIATETWKAATGSIEVPLGAEPPEAEPEPEPEPARPLELPPDDELLATEPLLPAIETDPVLPGLPPPRTEGGNVVIEEIVASINGRILTRSMYLDRIGWYQETLLNEDPPDLEERLKSLASETLDTTIDRWVLLEEAKQRSADIEGYWRDWIAHFRKQVGAADMAELDRLLAEQGTSVERLKEQVVETEIPNMYLQQEIAGRLAFSESELQAYFEKNRPRYQPPVTVSFRQILIPVEPGGDASKAEAIARTVIEELASGRDWCDLQAVYGQSGMPCAELEDIALTDLLPDIQEPASGLPIGATSRPIRTRQGLHVLRVSKRVGAEPVAFAEVRDRVLQDLRSEVFEQELARALDELRGSAVIEINDRYAALASDTLQPTVPSSGQGS